MPVVKAALRRQQEESWMTRDCIPPGEVNDFLPAMDEAQAELYVANEKLANHVARKMARSMIGEVNEIQMEDIQTLAQNGFMRGIVGFKGSPEEVARQLQYAVLCAKRAASKRIGQYARNAVGGPKRILALPSHDGGPTRATVDDHIATPGRRCQRDAGDLLSVLSTREADLIRMKFGIGGPAKTIAEICVASRLSRRQVKDLLSGAMAQLTALARAGQFD